eukprot:1724041-Pleurochrysis_carterae.AAC.2
MRRPSFHVRTAPHDATIDQAQEGTPRRSFSKSETISRWSRIHNISISSASHRHLVGISSHSRLR